MKLTIATMLLLLMVAPAFAQQTRAGADKNDTNPPKALDQTDKKFLKDAAIDNVAEVEMGQLAEQKASSSDVKQFGARMVKDHSAANDKLKALAAAEHVALPTELDAQHKNAKASLSNLTGKNFEQAYMSLMVQDHTKAVQKFQKEASSASAQSVKQFASTTVPTLEEHLKEAKNIESKVQNEAVR